MATPRIGSLIRKLLFPPHIFPYAGLVMLTYTTQLVRVAAQGLPRPPRHPQPSALDQGHAPRSRPRELSDRREQARRDDLLSRQLALRGLGTVRPQSLVRRAWHPCSPAILSRQTHRVRPPQRPYRQQPVRSVEQLCRRERRRCHPVPQ